MQRMLSFIFSLGLMGCSVSDTVSEVAPLSQEPLPQEALSQEPIGYLGFVNHQEWAIQFNDCTVFDLTGAQSYQWLDRTLVSVSCYTFKPNDAIEPLSVYVDANLNSSKLTPIKRFKELQVSESGWGQFPAVYETNGTNWLRVKEGWIHLTLADQTLVQFYPGTQDQSGKPQHEQYFEEH
ncbi:hypothetical protein AB4455_18475 [Vibrio sp. 10N.261.46.E12]|uniref:hypothetical protein n=1 Tax=unclassified Vibrio TaxID=2614977 RepID=UPI000976D9F9|nr:MULTISPECIES: hypothetical protein [unclassified Vibrio]OMO37395.1 hypothetical protein BH584_23060 [Vibrio sp. 10N.261.45.E1]PMJ34231.1 hypothetical protein BCU27_24650 [Vibrio sp. 10N.286.45.B6]PMM72933.1 hypothetical protein BCT48_05345 [Vibrio sp. 10N.261.46.F12]PMM90554.1 hypothetical protein BCT46_22210 [Vibrio sp. 10N.261.46.E8]PMN42772.1 hypothetical protein BCT34_01985 [Vibrio sp. 10N.261.45.E2]